MEKPGMGRRSPLHGPGLLIRRRNPYPLRRNPRPGCRHQCPWRLLRGLCLALLLARGPSLPAQDTGRPADGAQNPLRVLIRTSPDAPAAGALWTVTLLVDHPLPSEVEVQPPPLPSSLGLERMRSEPRLVPQGPDGENERWTAMEFQFSLRGSGRIALGPFEVTVPGGSALTPPLSISVRGAPEPLFRPQLGWQHPPTLRAGEPAELILTLSGWDPRRALPGPGLFLPKTPPGAILELVSDARDRPSQAAEPAALLRLNVIPLGAQNGEGSASGGNFFTLPQASIAFEGLSLTVPALRVPVLPAAAGSGGEPAPDIAGAAVAAETAAAIPGAAGATAAAFPAGDTGGFLFRSACAGIREQAEALWAAGRRAEALGELRRNERDLYAGPALIPLRREAEQALGLAAQGNEKWRPRLLLAAGLLLCLGLLALTMIARYSKGLSPQPIPLARPAVRGNAEADVKTADFKIGSVTTYFSRGYKCILILLAAGAGLCLWGLGDSAGQFLPGSARYALVRETDVRRVPEPEGAVNAHFREGARVLIRSDRLNWAYVESPAGAGAGWVRSEDIISY